MKTAQFTRAARRRMRPAGAIGAAAAASVALAVMTASAASASAAGAASSVTYNWVKESPATSPPPAYGVMAYDAASGQTILQASTTSAIPETWDWNGQDWTRLQASEEPPALAGASLAYDPAIGNLVLFGGVDSGAQLLNQTWVWNGSTWTQLDPATPPPARDNASLAYDPATDLLMLFGGNGANGYLNDTYVFNPVTLNWTQINPADKPAPRQGASLAYDPATKQMLLFGGQESEFGYSADTWLWTGSNWTTADNPSPVPQARGLASLTYDPTTGQLILNGGSGVSDQVFSDTWSWTGTAWIELSLGSSPGPRSAAAATYDGTTGQLVLFGGQNNLGEMLNDTWTYGPPPSAPAITSAGSATFTTGSAGTFTVNGTGYPLPVITEIGDLPAGLSLSPSGVLSGIPANGSGKAYDLIITASNGVGTPVTQDFLLIVDEAPVITSLNHASFVTGSKGTFKVKADAYPAPKFTETGALPAGLTLSSAGVLSGTPTAPGKYKVTLIATNSTGTGRQSFTLTVVAGPPTNPPPVIISLNNAAFVVGSHGKFTVKANEQATFSETGALPSGLTLSATGVLSGTPEAEGTYKIELMATNSNGTGKQAFKLTVDA